MKGRKALQVEFLQDGLRVLFTFGLVSDLAFYLRHEQLVVRILVDVSGLAKPLFGCLLSNGRIKVLLHAATGGL